MKQERESSSGSTNVSNTARRTVPPRLTLLSDLIQLQLEMLWKSVTLVFLKEEKVEEEAVGGGPLQARSGSWKAK